MKNNPKLGAKFSNAFGIKRASERNNEITCNKIKIYAFIMIMDFLSLNTGFKH